MVRFLTIFRFDCVKPLWEGLDRLDQCLMNKSSLVTAIWQVRDGYPKEIVGSKHDESCTPTLAPITYFPTTINETHETRRNNLATACC